MSTATPKLNLENIDPADFIDPEAFNRNAAKIDRLGTCYVVASGTSGEWQWRKWSDGTAECWITNKTYPDQAMFMWGVLYSTHLMRFGAYPFNFSAVPSVEVSFNGCNNSGAWPFVSKTSESTVSQPPAFCLYSPQNETITAPRFGVYARGKAS